MTNSSPTLSASTSSDSTPIVPAAVRDSVSKPHVITGTRQPETAPPSPNGSTGPAKSEASARTLPFDDVTPRDRPYFEDDELHSLFSRAASYLNAGVPLRFHGPAGMGKTATALRVAQARGRPVALLSGHDGLTSQDLIGQENGSHTTRVEDKYVASVRKSETRVQKNWSDGALLSSMTKGHTLVYDEFTRAPPEANIPLLSVIEEGVMVVVHPIEGRKVYHVHPDFRVILTSNPTDYRGTKSAPDALLDRVITFNFEDLSSTTRRGIIQCATGISSGDAETIVRLLSVLKGEMTPTAAHSLRTGILIARIVSHHDLAADVEDPRFIQVAADVLRTRLTRTDTEAAVRDAGLAVAKAGRPPASQETGALTSRSA